jgi:hypothetical protein
MRALLVAGKLKKIILKQLIIKLILTVVMISAGQLRGQVFEIKSWGGTYPDMNGSYPLSFVSFQGFLPPVPYFFIRTWPTHYYIEVGAAPVTDAPELAGSIKTGFLRIVEKLLEQSQMQLRSEETTQIKDNNLQQRDIELKLFNARSDSLPDLYNIAAQFIRIYQSISVLGRQQNTAAIAGICHREADELLVRFLMVNLLQTDHGKKLEAFAEIRNELTRQLGETDYVNRKVYHFNFYKQTSASSYAFLTR